METWATKEAFFACEVPREKITVPNSAIGQIWVYGLTSGEKDEYESRVMQFNARNRELKMRNARAVLMQMTIRDRHGNLMFAQEDLGRLAVVPAMVADPILDIARRLSGMATGEMEELVKNSPTGPAPDDDGSDTESQTPKDGPWPKPSAA
jgi:hypothetical protein